MQAHGLFAVLFSVIEFDGIEFCTSNNFQLKIASFYSMCYQFSGLFCIFGVFIMRLANAKHVPNYQTHLMFCSILLFRMDKNFTGN